MVSDRTNIVLVYYGRHIRYVLIHAIKRFPVAVMTFQGHWRSSGWTTISQSCTVSEIWRLIFDLFSKIANLKIPDTKSETTFSSKNITEYHRISENSGLATVAYR